MRRPYIEVRVCWGDTRIAELNRIGTVNADVRIVKRRERLDGKVNIASPGRLHARMHRARAQQASGFVFGAPVHYPHAASSHMGLMVSLFYSNGKSGAPDVLSFKPAAAIASARRAVTTAALDDMQNFFTISNMPIVSSRYWNMVHGCTPEEVEQYQEGLWTMRQLGRTMDWLLKSLEAGRDAGIDLPDREVGPFKSFIRYTDTEKSGASNVVRRPIIEVRVCWVDTRLAEHNRIGTVDADVRIVKRRERLDGKVNIAGPGILV